MPCRLLPGRPVRGRGLAGHSRHPHRTLRPAQRPPVAARPVPARVRVRRRAAPRLRPVTPGQERPPLTQRKENTMHPQNAERNTAMHPGRRTGVRFVLTNPSDPSRLNEFTDWYDTYSAALTVPGYLASDVHFENPGASGAPNRPRYATIYDIVSPDPATAWPDTEHSAAYPAHLFSDPRAKLVSPALRASYALVGSQLQPGPHGPLTGVHVILSNGSGDTERQQAAGGPDPANGLVLLRRAIPA